MRSLSSYISLSDARLFLIRNNKAQAIANGTWPTIRDQWNAASAAVEADKIAFCALPKPDKDKQMSEEAKARMRKSMKFVRKYGARTRSAQKDDSRMRNLNRTIKKDFK